MIGRQRNGSPEHKHNQSPSLALRFSRQFCQGIFESLDVDSMLTHGQTGQSKTAGKQPTMIPPGKLSFPNGIRGPQNISTGYKATCDDEMRFFSHIQ
jgi:hypothetical protein